MPEYDIDAFGLIVHRTVLAAVGYRSQVDIVIGHVDEHAPDYWVYNSGHLLRDQIDPDAVRAAAKAWLEDRDSAIAMAWDEVFGADDRVALGPAPVRAK